MAIREIGMITSYKKQILPEFSTEVPVNVAYRDVYHFADVKTDRFIPFAIDRLYDEPELGYRLLNNKEVVGYFDNLDDAREFVYQAYDK